MPGFWAFTSRKDIDPIAQAAMDWNAYCIDAAGVIDESDRLIARLASG